MKRKTVSPTHWKPCSTPGCTLMAGTFCEDLKGKLHCQKHFRELPAVQKSVPSTVPTVARKRGAVTGKARVQRSLL